MAAAIVRNFFNEIRPSLEEELKRESQKISIQEGQSDVSDEDAAEEEENARIEAEKREEEVRRRHSQSGWDDGRSRH